MDKKLCDMSLQKLWRLFPVTLCPPSPAYIKQYEDEKNFICSFLPEYCRINHIGSTAVGNILSKPIVDILTEIPHECQMTPVKDLLLNNGYICMSESADRMSFNKGYTLEGYAPEVFHLHLRFYGDNDELYFNKYLIEHPETAKEYEAVKLALCAKYKYDRDKYTQGKTDFINKYTELAKKQYRLPVD